MSAGKFFWYFLFLFLTLMYYSFYGILTVVISPSVQARAVSLHCFSGALSANAWPEETRGLQA